MTRRGATDTLLLLSRLVVGGTFAYAATTKIADLSRFAEDIANYQMIPPALTPLFAAALAGIELTAGVLLVLGVWAEASSAILAGLLAVFIAALSQALTRGIDLRCGCFGGADLATWGTVGRDVALFIPALAVMVWGAGLGQLFPERATAKATD